MKNLMIGFCGALTLMACSKESVQQTFQEPRLMKNWETKCASSDILDLSKRSYFAFSGDTFKEVHTFYQDETCTQPAAEATYTGTFNLGPGPTGEAGATALDLKYDKAYMVAVTEAGKEKLEGVKLCGHDSFPLNAQVEMTPDSAGILCPMTTAPSARYEIYRMDGDKLYVGNAGIGSRAKTEGERPTALDMENPYVPTNRAL